MNSSPRLASSPVRGLIICVVMALCAGVLAFVGAIPANASCAAQPMAGDWRNTNSGTRSITRVIVGFNCGDVRLCDTNGSCTGGESYFTVRPFGKCHPTDCDWGTKRTQPMSDGWQRATYPRSWATTYVWVKSYTYYGRLYLRVYTRTDFTAADGRTDYSSDEWMLK